MKLHPARLVFVAVLIFLLYVFIASFVRKPPVTDASPVILAGWIDSQSFTAQYRYQNGWVRDGRHIMISAFEMPVYRYGQQVMIRGVVEYVPERDFFRMQKTEISLADFPRSRAERVKVSLYQNIYSVRDWFLAGVSQALPEPYAAFINGILVGARSQLPQSIKDDFARTSTSHIIAVSGFNITIIANVIGWLALFVMRRNWAFWVCVGGLFLFMILTGAQASVVRATIMGILLLLSQRVGRLPTPLHTLVLTAGAMVALDQRILRFDIGFQLSFLATAGILLVSPLLDARIPYVKHFGKLREIFIMTISAQLCVIPLLIYYFKSLSLVSLPANLIILPWIPWTMLAGFFAGIAGAFLPILGQIIGTIAYLMSFFILQVIRFFAGISWAAVTVELSWPWIVVMYAILGGACRWLAHRKPSYGLQSKI